MIKSILIITLIAGGIAYQPFPAQVSVIEKQAHVIEATRKVLSTTFENNRNHIKNEYSTKYFGK